MHKKERKSFSNKDFREYLLAGDVGGTNTTLGLFGIKNKVPILLVSFHYNSKELNSLDEAINEVVEICWKQHKIKIKNASFAVAGFLDFTNKDSG